MSVCVCLCVCVCVREGVCVDVCLRVRSACVRVHMRLHVDTRLWLRIRASACVRACMCLYANVCMWLPVLLECAGVMVAEAAGALTGWGSGRGQGRRKSHFLSVQPPTKLYFCQS